MKVSISVVIPYYKSQKFFRKCFNSVKQQTYQPKEIIIICDEPTKKAKIFLKKITSENKKTKIIYNKKNLGVSYCRNLGVKIAKSKYIAFLDSDDYWKKNKLVDQIHFMKKKNIDFSHTSYFIVNEKNEITSQFEIEPTLSFKRLLCRCDIGTSTVIIKKTLLKKNKFPMLSNQEDYCVWLKIAKKKNIFGLNKNLSFWRKRKNSLSTKNFQKLKNAYSIYAKHLGYNKIVSFYRLMILIIFNINKKLNTHL